jgi:hypothetical protein
MCTRYLLFWNCKLKKECGTHFINKFRTNYISNCEFNNPHVTTTRTSTVKCLKNIAFEN